jgi:hypothetical protein
MERTLRDNFRYLRPKKLGRNSKTFFVLDVETGIRHPDGTIEYMLSARPEHFIFGVIFGAEGFKHFESIAEMQKELRKRKYKNKIVYAHNAEYDLSCLFDNIYYLDPRACFNGKFISCTNGVAKFGDSFNIMPTSVKKLGDLLGLPKLDLGDNLRSHISRLDKDITYCMRDCEIVYRSLEKIFADIEPSYTIGSLSLKLFRKEFLKHAIKVDPISDKFFNALYGGRNEAFRIGDVRAHVYDLNSAYPWAMTELSFPDPSALRVGKFPVSDLYYGCGYEGMIHATVVVDRSEYIPALPYRYDGKLLFPAGRFTGYWTLSEMRHALQTTKTRIEAIHSVVYAEPIETPFRDFIFTLFNKRNATNNAFEKYYYKLFMNNLYGKLIQQSHDEYVFCRDEVDALRVLVENKAKRVEIIKCVGGYFARYDSHKLFEHTIAPWGAYITAFVRIALHSELIKNPRASVYCDTDSIASEKVLPYNSSALGGWKRERKMITQVRALKDYVYYDETDENIYQSLKGVKKDSRQLDAEANAFIQKRMIRTRESFARKDLLPPGTFIDQMKFITGTYKKREVLKNGDTKPFILNL